MKAEDTTQAHQSAQDAPDGALVYKGRPVTQDTLARLRDALRLHPGHPPLIQEDLDAFSLMASSDNPMENAMEGLSTLGSHPKTIAAAFCAMGAEVRERIFGYGTTADCFCGMDRDVDTTSWGWTYSQSVVRFIRDAVAEKLEREELPEKLVTAVPGRRIHLERIKGNVYQVARQVEGAY